MAQAQLHTHPTLPQAQFLPQPNQQPQPSMVPISRNASPKGGRYCIFKGCFEIRHSYNTMRDHILHHSAFRKQMMAYDKSYEHCCENTPHFRNAQMRCPGCQRASPLACQACKRRWLHRFKLCPNAPANLRHLISKVWTTTEMFIYNDEHWNEDPSEK